jgi:hypothetical protein
MSVGSTTSSMVTSADEFWPPSLIADAAICECSSTIPAVKCLPVPSISMAFLSFKSLPIFAIFPSFKRISVFFRIPSASLVQTVT